MLWDICSCELTFCFGMRNPSSKFCIFETPCIRNFIPRKSQSQLCMVLRAAAVRAAQSARQVSLSLNCIYHQLKIVLLRNMFIKPMVPLNPVFAVELILSPRIRELTNYSLSCCRNFNIHCQISEYTQYYGTAIYVSFLFAVLCDIFLTARSIVSSYHPTIYYSVRKVSDLFF